MGITAANDNGLWFVEQKGLRIVRMATTGDVTAEYPLPGAITPDRSCKESTETSTSPIPPKNKIGQFLFRKHGVKFFSIPTANSQPTAMTIGADGQVYFVETAGNKVGQFRYFNV